MADKVPGIGRGGLKIRQFVHLILEMRERAKEVIPSDLIRIVLDKTGYEEELKLEGTDDARDRLENIGELLNKAASYEAAFYGAQLADEIPPGKDPADGAAREQRPTLQGFLEEVSLVADIDSFDGQEDRVVLMTLHSAKGLEFPNVYITGMDEGLFPGYQAVMSGETADMEEERRLCYVGITRAMDHLTLTGAHRRMLRGQMDWYRESRFLEELRGTAEEEKPEKTRPRSYGASPKQWETAAKSIGEKKPFLLSAEPAPQVSSTLGYEVGDTVSHVKFGNGVVTQIRDGGRDKEVTVEFERFGVKKMFAGFAKLKRVP